jgi:carbamoyl-phosphate synthase small subunit
MSGEKAHLCLADGSIFEGIAWGAPGVATGEVVFTTGMTGYEEVLTDPSYCGQIVTMTAPQIGNTGINPEDTESVVGVPQVAGFIVRDMSAESSNYRATETLHAYLNRHGVVAISAIDTRALTRHLRDHGSQNGAIGTLAPEVLVRRAREAEPMEGLDLVKRVTPQEPYSFSESSGIWASSASKPAERHVVAIDMGLKRNILRCLVDAGCRLTVVPASTKADDILALRPDGVFISNGPGDPAAVTYAVETIDQLLGKTPMFGICLGHQILGHALGGATFKLPFGHHGGNHPVRHVPTNSVEITSQNHNYAVDPDSLDREVEITHVNLNDGVCEGLRVTGEPVFSVQHHPEAGPGPHDAAYLFTEFTMLMAGS